MYASLMYTSLLIPNNLSKLKRVGDDFCFLRCCSSARVASILRPKRASADRRFLHVQPTPRLRPTGCSSCLISYRNESAFVGYISTIFVIAAKAAISLISSCEQTPNWGLCRHLLESFTHSYTEKDYRLRGNDGYSLKAVFLFWQSLALLIMMFSH